MIRALASALLVAVIAAATSPSRAETVLIPGSLRGIGTMGPSGVRRMCSPLIIGLYDWHVDWVTRIVKPTVDQGARLHDLVAASNKVKDVIAAACHDGEILTSTDQLAVMDERVTALQESIKIIRPAYESFYSSLDSRQKARLDAMGPAR
jgi:hypothetical protein